MRLLILASVAVLTAGQALASSIQVISADSVSLDSVTEVNCADCPALKPREERSEYTVPALASGTQRTDVVNVDGQKMLMRTKSWMGGSPVVYVSKGDGWATDANGFAVAISKDGVDLSSKTAAVDDKITGDGSAVSADLAQSPADDKLDLDNFDLRLR